MTGRIVCPPFSPFPARSLHHRCKARRSRAFRRCLPVHSAHAAAAAHTSTAANQHGRIQRQLHTHPKGKAAHTAPRAARAPPRGPRIPLDWIGFGRVAVAGCSSPALRCTLAVRAALACLPKRSGCFPPRPPTHPVRNGRACPCQPVRPRPQPAASRHWRLFLGAPLARALGALVCRPPRARPRVPPHPTYASRARPSCPRAPPVLPGAAVAQRRCNVRLPE